VAKIVAEHLRKASLEVNQYANSGREIAAAHQLSERKEAVEAAIKMANVGHLVLSNETPLRVPWSGLGFGVHIPPEYRELAPTSPGSKEPSLFHEIASMFLGCGITVHQNPIPGAATVIVLCPELYSRPDLVHSISCLLPSHQTQAETNEAAAKPNRRGSFALEAGGARRRSSGIIDTSAITGGGAPNQAERGSMQIIQGDSREVMTQMTNTAWLPMFSTASTLSWYGNQCPSALREKGALDSFEFEPWPTSPSLQEAATIAIAKDMLTRVDELAMMGAPAPRLPAPSVATGYKPGQLPDQPRPKARRLQDQPRPKARRLQDQPRPKARRLSIGGVLVEADAKFKERISAIPALPLNATDHLAGATDDLAGATDHLAGAPIEPRLEVMTITEDTNFNRRGSLELEEGAFFAQVILSTKPETKKRVSHKPPPGNFTMTDYDDEDSRLVSLAQQTGSPPVAVAQQTPPEAAAEPEARALR